MLANEAPCDADIVVPIPDSGVPAAIGFSQASGIPFELGIIRSIEVDKGWARIGVYIASANCPMLDYLLDQIKRRVQSVNGIKSVDVVLLEGPSTR